MLKSQKKVNHLVYRISDRDDLIHPFSPEGYELLNDEFLSFPEMMRPTMQEENPILMELTGWIPDEKDREAVDRAIRVHYQLRLSKARDDIRTFQIKIFWFLVSFFLSAFLLFAVNDKTQDLFVQYAYLPFWFFGYRLLIYPIFEYLPSLKEKKWFEQLCSMKLVYTKEPMGEIPEELSEQTCRETTAFKEQALKNTRNHELVRNYFVEQGQICLESVVSTPEQVLSPHGVKGNEIITDQLGAYLEQALPFVSPSLPVKLTFRGCNLVQEEKESILRGLKQYFTIRTAAAENQVKDNYNQILHFTIGVVLASIVLYTWGSQVGAARHELMLIVLWFFGDYLIEYILLTDKQLKAQRDRWKKLKDMDVTFSE